MSAFAIMSYLLGRDTGFTAANGGAEKIYPVKAPQTVKPPFTVMNILSGTETKLLAVGDAEYFHTRMQLEFLDTNATTVDRMATAARAALRGVIKQSFDGYEDIDVVFADLELSDYDDNRTMMRRVLHYRIHWRDKV